MLLAIPKQRPLIDASYAMNLDELVDCFWLKKRLLFSHKWDRKNKRKDNRQQREYEIDKLQGRNSQNFLGKFVRFFENLRCFYRVVIHRKWLVHVFYSS